MVKTHSSAGGITPELGLAREHGMRCIHVPIGYDGMEEKSRASMARCLAVGMAKLDRAYDNLAALSKADWRQELPRSSSPPTRRR
jgi:hypothetical protein